MNASPCASQSCTLDMPSSNRMMSALYAYGEGLVLVDGSVGLDVLKGWSSNYKDESSSRQTGAI